jgi:Domain of unknown function (DUF5103)
MIPMHYRTPRVLWFSQLAALLGCAGSLSTTPTAAPEDYWQPQATVQYTDRIYWPSVRTVQLFKVGNELSAPLLELGSGSMQLRFDLLDADPAPLSYTLVHCNAQWQPSELSPAQYLDGAFSEFMPPGQQSINTLQPYVHYSVQLPTALMRPKVSGNYIVKVYHSDDEEDVVLTRRLLVAEQRVSIDASVVASRDVSLRNVAQQVDMVVRHPGLLVPDPFNDLQLVVLQNMRWDDARTGLRPRFVRSSELVYDHPSEALFMGGNEWRNFDLKNLRYLTQEVARMDNRGNLTEAYLLPDPKRNIRTYFEQPDINGRYLVRNDDGYQQALESDYIHVHFTLPLEQEFTGAQVFVYGGLTDGQCQREWRMSYLQEQKAYVLRALLKQGFYNYAYAVVPDSAEHVGQFEAIEGSHFQTENDYAVLAYFNDPMLGCQRLVGTRFLNSRSN